MDGRGGAQSHRGNQMARRDHSRRAPCRNDENIQDEMDKVVVGTSNVDPSIPPNRLKICSDSRFPMFEGAHRHMYNPPSSSLRSLGRGGGGAR